MLLSDFTDGSRDGQVKKGKKISKASHGVNDGVLAFGDRVHEARRKVGMSQLDMSIRLGRRQNGAISRIELGQATSIPIDMLLGVAQLLESLGYTAQWLLTGEAISDSLTPEQIRRYLCDHAAVELAEDLAVQIAPAGRAAIGAEPGYRTVPPEDVPTSRDWHEHYVPVIGRIAAGEGFGADEATKYPPSWAGEFLVYDGAAATAVAVRVKGQSMEPDYHDGDMVVVDPAREADAGSVACVMLERHGIREARLKRYKLSGGWVILESTNPDAAQKAERISPVDLVSAFPIVDHLPLIRV